MEIPLDGSNKFGRELVESGVLEYIENNFKDKIILNSRNPVTDNAKVFRGSVRQRFVPVFKDTHGNDIKNKLNTRQKGKDE